MKTRRFQFGAAGLALTLAWSWGCAPAVDGPSEAPSSNMPRDGGPVILGAPWLTAGIPGEGPLKRHEIEAWLQDPRNHRLLDPLLPSWLSGAEDQLHVPEDNPLTPAKIELGRQLFFDHRLSGLGTFSCATCHQPQQSFSSYQVMPEVGRNASAVFNRVLGREQFWDGRADSLESQPESPVKNPFEMNSSPEQTTAAVAAIEGYAIQFDAIFGEVSFANICRALASFERVIVAGPTAWDYERLLREETSEPGGDGDSTETSKSRQGFGSWKESASRQPMSEAARRGKELFFGDRAGCGNCHTGPNLTDEQYHNLGVGFASSRRDPGRMRVTEDREDYGAFKTPSLRNVARTPPYMHNGQFGYLEEVVDFLDRGGHANDNLSPLIRPLGLSRDEKADLVAFLEALTGDLPPVETGRLPEE